MPTINQLVRKPRKIANKKSKSPALGRIHNALNGVLKDYQKIGYLETGVWRGSNILDLKYGDTVNNGYLIQSEPIDEQNQSDRENRIAPPIYIALKLAGAITFTLSPWLKIHQINPPPKTSASITT